MLTSFTHQFTYAGVFAFRIQSEVQVLVLVSYDYESTHMPLTQENLDFLGIKPVIAGSGSKQYHEWLQMIPFFFIVVAFVLVYVMH